MSSRTRLVATVLGVFLLPLLLSQPVLSQSDTGVKPFPGPPSSSDTQTDGVGGFKDPFATGSGTETRKEIELSDPLEPWNRSMLTVNRVGYDYVGEPVAEVYRDYTPEPVRSSFRRFFANLYEPTYAVNSLLQGEFYDASVASRRFVINSTFGGLGFFDPAAEHLQRVERDFDQTLGKWGVSPGFYLVWPLIGPSSPRGTVGYLVDETLDPLNYAGDLQSVTVISAHRIISETSYQIGQFKTLDKFSVDQYAAIKDFYEKQLYEKSKR